MGQLATEFPEVQDILSMRLKEADLKIPTRPTATHNSNATQRRIPTGQ